MPSARNEPDVLPPEELSAPVARSEERLPGRPRRSVRILVHTLLALAFLVACSGPEGGSGAAVSVTVVPDEVVVVPNGRVPVEARIEPDEGSVTWHAGCGSFEGSGTRVTYVAGGTEVTCDLWATSTVDRNASGWATVTVAYPFGDLLWRYETGAFLDTAPAVGDDGTIYVGSRDQHLYAIRPDGTLRWRYATGADIRSDPTVAADGTIVFGADDHRVYALRPDGSVAWTFSTELQVLASPAVAADGTTYVASWDGALYALDPTGNEMWHVETGNSLMAAPAIGADGVVYQGSLDGHVYAVLPNGDPAWRHGSGDRSYRGTSIDHLGRILAVSDAGLEVLEPDGALAWSFDAAAGWGEATVGSDGTIHLLTSGGLLRTFSADGTPLWSYDLGTGASPATIGDDGTLYAAGSTGELLALDPAGEIVWRSIIGAARTTPPTLAQDGTVYVAGGPNLYAFESGSTGLADAPWPKVGRDGRNTGSVGSGRP